MTDRPRSDTALDWLAQRQLDDGSFGHQARPTARIVTTIFVARSLQEAGLTDAPPLRRALDFLAAAAIVEGGGGSISGTRDSVLSCYTGMLARLLIRGGRLETAGPLVDWIVRYQPVIFGERVYHAPSGPMWGDYLTTRYGGCMASTTCLLGVVPAMSALVAAREAGLKADVTAQVAAVRQLLIDRRIMFARSGSILPLAGRTKADPDGTRWLVPAFPLDYVIDLVELVQLAVDVGVPSEAMTEAVAMIGSWRLRDGDWPMLGKRRIAEAYRPEPVNRSRASELITRRVRALGVAVP